MKKSILFILAISLLGTMNFAANANATFSGSVGEIANISVKNENTALDLTQAQTGVLAFTVVADSNDPNGFSLTFHSANAGQLRNVPDYAPGITATYLDYTIDVIENGNGVLGATSAQGKTNLSLALDKALDYDTVAQASDAAEWDIDITYPAKVLLSGAFNDTVTVTLANL